VLYANQKLQIPKVKCYQIARPVHLT
jgi:hypothetical protein